MMTVKYGLAIVAVTLLINVSAFADCNFVIANKSAHPVTIQGFFLEGGDELADSAWVTVSPNQQIIQIRSGKKCNDIYHHTGQIVTRINLKNHSGFWVGNKGLVFTPDRAYSHYIGGERALADNGQKVTLSNGTKVNSKTFKVYICETNLESNDCR